MKQTSLYRSNSPPLVLLPVCIGICIYTANHVIATTVTSPIALSVVKWILHSLPNGLWLFALLNLYRLFCNKHSFYQNLFWLSIITLLAFAIEYLQAFDLVSGKFEIMDLLSYECAAIVTIYLAFSTHIKHLFAS